MRALSLLLLAACTKAVDDTGADPFADAPLRSCDVVLTARPPLGVEDVAVAGAFNDYDPQPMTDVDGDGVYERRLGALTPGVWGYKLVLDGVFETVPPDVFTAWDGGFENRALRVADCLQPGLETLHGEATADGALTAAFQWIRASDGAPVDPDSVEVTLGDRTAAEAGAEVAVDDRTGEIVVTATGLPEGKVSVRVTATDLAGRAPDVGEVFLPLWVEPHPFAWQEGLLYYVFLDRFRDAGGTFPPIDGTEYDGANYLGGDLVGATEAIEEGWFDDLGVKVIWLSPVYQNPDAAYAGSGGWHYTGYHGYWPVEPREVEDRLGTDAVAADAALKTFVQTAHAHGIRVILDTVLNHVHEDHPYVDAYGLGGTPCVCTTDAGPCNWDTNPLGCWFTDYLPDVDYREPELVTQMVDDLDWWVRTYDVDGFRVDAAKHMDHVIMRSLSLHLKERYSSVGGAPFYLVGETFTGQGGQALIADYVAPWELDGQFDFPLLYPIRNGIGHDQGFRGLASEVAASEAVYGDRVHGMSVFLGNHDVGRYATELTGCDHYELFGGCTDVLAAGATTGQPTGAEWEVINRMALSFAFVLTQPGVPMLYYGDEVGLAGAGDPDNRRLMPWSRTVAQDTLLARVQELGTLRTQVPALWSGDRVEMWVDDTLYVYARDAGGGDVAVVALYRGSDSRTQTMWAPTRLGLEGRSLTDALAGNRTTTVSDGQLTLTLDPFEYVVLVPE